MESINWVSCAVAAAMLAGCSSTSPPGGPKGPDIVTAGRSTEAGHYAEVGVAFSTWGDFVALLAPTRWKSPVATGGSLSWLNPGAWSEDAGRTGRILIGQAALVGGAVALAAAADDSGSSSGGTGGGDGGGDPTPPPSGPPSGPGRPGGP